MNTNTLTYNPSDGRIIRKPNITDDAISRSRAMETFSRWAEHKDYTHVERHILHAVVDELRAMPSIGEEESD